MKSDFKVHCIALCKNEPDVIGVCLHEATKWADYIYVYDGGWLPVFAPEEPFLRGRKVASIRKRMPGRKTQWNPAECAYTCSPSCIRL